MPTGRSSEAAAPAAARAWRPSLRQRYAATFVALVSLPLLIYGLVSVTLTWRQQQQALSAVQSAQADASAVRIAQFLREVERGLQWLAQLTWTPGNAPRRRREALRVLRPAPAITDIGLVDAQWRGRVGESRPTGGGWAAGGGFSGAGGATSPTGGGMVGTGGGTATGRGMANGGGFGLGGGFPLGGGTGTGGGIFEFDGGLCGPMTCAGCCAFGYCLAGDTIFLCGSGGQDCESCDFSMGKNCINNSCQ